MRTLTSLDPVSIRGSKVVENGGPGFQPGSCWYRTETGEAYKILPDKTIRSIKGDSWTYHPLTDFQVRYNGGEDLFS